MPKVEIDIDDAGNVGTLPEPIQKLFDDRIAKKFGDVKSLEAQIAALKAGGTPDPVERERLKSLELENSRLKEAEAIREKRHDDARALAETRHAAALKERDDQLVTSGAELAKRTARVREIMAAQIRLEASAAGARDESLDELQALLGPRIGLDDALQPIVLDSAGKAALDKDGKPVTIEGLVTQYVADHPHHRAAAPGRGGRAPGGRSLHGPALTGIDAEKAAIQAELEKNPSIDNLARSARHWGKGAA